MTKCNTVHVLARLFLFLCVQQVPYCQPATSPEDHSLVLNSPGGVIRGSIEGVEGEIFTATCTAVTTTTTTGAKKPAPVSLEWVFEKEQMRNPRLSQTRVNNFSVSLTISKLNRSDAGIYHCVMELPDDEAEEKQLEVLVRPENEKTDVCGVTRFRCVASGDCIFNRYMCDGVPNCPQDGSDESEDLCSGDPCKGKFLCNNSRCIERRLVCDSVDTCEDGSDETGCLPNSGDPCKRKFLCNNSRCIEHRLVCDGVDTCEDGSDETGCLPNSAHTTPNSLSEEDEHFNWLKTTVYTVIGCTVATVILISFIVIVVFRLKMKRLRARRLAHQLHRQRARNMGAGDGPSDQDPFLAFTTQSHYGNIIVNVNNGVQCVGGAAGSHLATTGGGFQRDKPPPYSEVVHKGADFPLPPPYSTVDRANQQRRQGQNGADNVSLSGRSVGAGSCSGSSPGGLLSLTGSGVAIVGPPLSHPARQQYLQRNSTGSQEAGGGAGNTHASVSTSSSVEQSSSSAAVGQRNSRNSTTSEGQTLASASAAVIETTSPQQQQQSLVSTPLPPPPSPPPPPTPPPPPPPTSGSQPRDPAAVVPTPLPPPRSTSIVDSRAAGQPQPPTPSFSLPPPSTAAADVPPPLPPRNDPLQPLTPHTPTAPAVMTGAGNLMVQEGKIVLTAAAPPPPPPPPPSASSSFPPTPSSTTSVASSPAAVASNDKDLAAAAVVAPTAVPGKLEVHQGQIILNMNPPPPPPATTAEEGERGSPQAPQRITTGGCELQVKDGKIIFKRQ